MNFGRKSFYFFAILAISFAVYFWPAEASADFVMKEFIVPSGLKVMAIQSVESAAFRLPEPKSLKSAMPALIYAGFGGGGGGGGKSEDAPRPKAFIKILTPNGGEVLEPGKTYIVKWESEQVPQVYIKLRKGDDTYSGPEGMISDVIKNEGYFEWKVPETLPAGKDYSIRVLDKDAPKNDVYDDSDTTFAITFPVPPPPLPSVSLPLQIVEQLTTLNLQAIKIATSIAVSDPAIPPILDQMALLLDALKPEIASDPVAAELVNQLSVLVAEAQALAAANSPDILMMLYKIDSALFALQKQLGGIPESPSSLNVLYPNGGEVFAYGDNLTMAAEIISSKSGGVASFYLIDESSGYKIELVSEGLSSLKGNKAIAGWTINKEFAPAGNHYKVLVEWKSDDGLEQMADTSDAPFSIVDALPTEPPVPVPGPVGTVTIFSPNGGENLVSGDIYTIKWASSSVPASANVNIWLLDDPTRFGEIIISNTPNDGAENWVVKPLTALNDPKTGQTLTPSGKYVMFIECVDYSCTVDDSDAPFSIIIASGGGGSGTGEPLPAGPATPVESFPTP